MAVSVPSALEYPAEISPMTNTTVVTAPSELKTISG